MHEFNVVDKVTDGYIRAIIKAVNLCQEVTEDSVTYDKAVKIIEILGAGDV